MRWIFAVLFFFASLARAADFALPAANQGAYVPGTNVGVPGGSEQYYAGKVNDRAATGNVINVVTAHSADNTGATNVSTAVAAAIAAASPGDLIWFPAGRYKFTSQVAVPSGKSNITIRGAGASTVMFMSMLNAQGVFYWPDIGYIPGDIQTITGTKTKGTTTLTVSSNSGYTTTDQFAWVAYQNEVDLTRIEAGVVPVWSSLGHAWSRIMTARVTGSTSTTISIEPGLPADGTDVAMRIHTFGLPSTKVVGWGFEDFNVEFDPAAHPQQAFNVNGAQYNWFHNVNFPDYSRAANNGSCIKIAQSFRCEVSFCRFDAETGSSSDGAIETGANTGNLIYDNIFTGPFGYNTYDSGNAVNCVISHNFGEEGPISGLHNAHPSLNVIEGNYAYYTVSDGYHGSSSNNNIYGNYFFGGGEGTGGWYALMLHRFKRQYLVARNFFGKDGVNTGRIAWGWPNYNPDADGFAGPTGASTQVGQVDRSQPGATNNTYVIQAGDVSAGDFWTDFEITGTLTTRTSDSEAVFTVSGGNWFTGVSPTGASQLYPRVHWNSKASALGGITHSTVTAVSGNQVTIVFSTGTLPIAGTAVQLYPGPAGWQERDLDVQPSSTVTHNYFGLAGGTGSIQNSSGDTFPASIVWPTKPAWAGTKPWPTFDVDDASTADPERLPAYHRFLNGNTDYLPGGGGGGGATNATVNQLNVGTFVVP